MTEQLIEMLDRVLVDVRDAIDAARDGDVEGVLTSFASIRQRLDDMRELLESNEPPGSGHEASGGSRPEGE